MTKNLLRKNRNILFCIAAFVCLPVFFGCKKEMPPVVSAAQPSKVVAPLPPKPVQKPVSSALRLPPPLTNQYDFTKRKDPFKPFVIVKPISVISEENAKKSSKIDVLPIHSFEVDKFTLIGIITGGKQSQAMVVDPNKKGYVLKEGMKIGNNDGVVKSITPSGVKVEERFTDDAGKRRTREIPLTLPRKQ